jgi:hypothetical protein
MNPPEMWVRRDTAFEPIVSQEIFFKAQAIIQESQKKSTDEELLDRLRRLMEREGRLSSRLIDEREDLPSRYAY